METLHAWLLFRHHCRLQSPSDMYRVTNHQTRSAYPGRPLRRSHQLASTYFSQTLELTPCALEFADQLLTQPTWQERKLIGEKCPLIATVMLIAPLSAGVTLGRHDKRIKIQFGMGAIIAYFYKLWAMGWTPRGPPFIGHTE